MSMEKGIAFFFQGIFLPTTLFLTIFELIAGWNLAQAQTIGQKVKMKRCFFVDPRVIAFDHLGQVFDRWEMVKHAFSLLPRELFQVLGLILEIEMVELHALFLVFFVFLTILEEALDRKDHTDHRHGYRRDDIEPPWLENGDQEGHPNHDEGWHDQLQEFIRWLLRLRSRRIDQDLVFRTPVDDPRRPVVLWIVLVKVVTRMQAWHQIRTYFDSPFHTKFFWIELKGHISNGKFIPKGQWKSRFTDEFVVMVEFSR